MEPFVLLRTLRYQRLQRYGSSSPGLAATPHWRRPGTRCGERVAVHLLLFLVPSPNRQQLALTALGSGSS